MRQFNPYKIMPFESNESRDKSRGHDSSKFHFLFKTHLTAEKFFKLLMCHFKFKPKLQGTPRFRRTVTEERHIAANLNYGHMLYGAEYGGINSINGLVNPNSILTEE